MRLLEEFFQALDAAWGASPDAEVIHLRIIGSAALMLQTNYRRGTKDSDILETAALRVDDNVVDVVVSKLKRFHANDQSDIAEMIDRDLFSHAMLVARFRSAVDVFAMDARAEALPRYVANFHRVEREHFDAAPTPIELPDWT